MGGTSNQLKKASNSADNTALGGTSKCTTAPTAISKLESFDLNAVHLTVSGELVEPPATEAEPFDELRENGVSSKDVLMPQLSAAANQWGVPLTSISPSPD